MNLVNQGLPILRDLSPPVATLSTIDSSIGVYFTIVVYYFRFDFLKAPNLTYHNKIKIGYYIILC